MLDEGEGPPHGIEGAERRSHRSTGPIAGLLAAWLGTWYVNFLQANVVGVIVARKYVVIRLLVIRLPRVNVMYPRSAPDMYPRPSALTRMAVAVLREQHLSRTCLVFDVWSVLQSASVCPPARPGEQEGTRTRNGC